MAIIKSTHNPPPNGISLDSFIYPNQYVSFKDKQNPDWIKNTCDYYAAVAYAQYQTNQNITKNYELLAGIFNFDDYKEDDDVQEFTKVLQGAQDSEAPKHLKHYPIVNPPINTLQGEQAKRPDVIRVKSIDEDSKNQYIKVKEDLIKKYITSTLHERVKIELAKQGIDIETEEGQEQAKALTPPEIEEYMRKSYSDIGEEWGNKKINVCKDYFNTAEKSEEAFKDLLVTSKEFHHFEMNESPLGFEYEVLNPRTVWYLGHPNIKYIDTTAYVVGFIDRYDLTYILNKWKFTEDEVEHLLRMQSNTGYGPMPTTGAEGTGINSIHYNVFNPLAYRQNLLNPGIITPDKNDIMYNYPSFGQYGNSAYEKFVCVKGYFQSKKKFGKRCYFDEEGNKQYMFVDETYEPLLKPKFKAWVKDDDDKIGDNLESGELVEWTYANEWWEFLKVGAEIYKCNPLKVNICPIVGLIHNNKNTPVRSLVDLMKPLQALYNVCMNQLYELLGKEMGVVALQSLRHIPKFKDLGDEALDIWEEQARQRGVIFVDDTPENLKSPSSFNNWTKLDLNRSQEMQSRYEIALRLKLECWELIGITKERLGSVAATQTATGTNTSLAQSYAQTEPLFRAHEHVMQKVYQTMLDICKYVEENKPESIISHVTNDMENIYLKVSGDELRTKNLMLFITNSGKDLQIFNELRSLAQPALQNGADFLDIINLFSTDSRAEIKNIFQKLKDERQAREQQAQQLEQQKIEQSNEAMQAQLEQAERQHQEDIENENYNKELDRLNKKEVAIISASGYGQVQTEDADGDGIQDILELSRLNMEEQQTYTEHLNKVAEIKHKRKESEDKHSLELEKLKLEKQKLENDKQKAITQAKLDRDNMKNDEKIARINAKNRNKPPKKK